MEGLFISVLNVWSCIPIQTISC